MEAVATSVHRESGALVALTATTKGCDRLAPQVLPSGRSAILKDGICVALEKPASNKLCPGELVGEQAFCDPCLLHLCQTSSPRDLYGPAKLCEVQPSPICRRREAL